MKKFFVYFGSLILVISLMLGVFFYFIFPSISSSANFISEFGQSKDLKSTDGRTNILVVGVDKRADKYIQTGTLTDTMIVISADKLNENVRLLSIPRDYWVEVNGGGTKINSVLTEYGFETLVSEIEEALGIDVHYTAKVDFISFEKAIDAVDGVTINNPSAFEDNFYPKFGWENETCGIDVEELKKEKLEELKAEMEEEGEDEDEIENLTVEDISLSQYDFPCRFERISFPEGEITLNGEQALKYARSRHSADVSQGTDFARAKRQHIIIFSLINKATSVKTLSSPTKLKELYMRLSESVETNLTLAEFLMVIPELASSGNYDLESAVLKDNGGFEEGGVLMQGDPERYNGLYVLVPKENNILHRFAEYYFYRSEE